MNHLPHLLHVTPDYFAWDWRPDVLIVLGLCATLYITGWLRLRRRGWPGVSGWRLAAYLAGLLLIGAALISPIDALASALFFMHMIQHVILMMLAPPLLMLANPYPFVVWGLPRPLRRAVRHLMSREAPFRRGVKALTSPFVAWMLFEAILWGWHDPNAYNAALRLEWVHDIEHLTFFFAACLFWWNVVNPPPYLNGRHSTLMRMLYLLLTAFVNLGPSVAIAMADRVIYTHYLTVDPPWPISPLTDQRISGVIMWIPGGMMLILAALALLARSSQEEGGRATRAAGRQAAQPGGA